MKVATGLLGSSFVLAAGAASAQESVAPPARLGFQMALRPGVAIPMGSLTGPVDVGSVVGIPHEKVSDFVSPQVAPLLVELGFKPVPNLFLGGYLGLSFGGAGGRTKELCDADRSDCTSVGLRIGLEAQYHVLPNRVLNPWVGYGIGLESLTLSLSGANDSLSVTYSGVEYAHFTGGADFRTTRSVGVGPFIDFAIGKYTRVSATDGNAELFLSTDVAHTALHGWFTLGGRVVVFP